MAAQAAHAILSPIAPGRSDDGAHYKKGESHVSTSV
jgi:hypothetical protein